MRIGLRCYIPYDALSERAFLSFFDTRLLVSKCYAVGSATTMRL
jgi:hypothetical protein